MSLDGLFSDRLERTFGFPISLGLKFEVEGKKYRFSAGDIDVLELLAAMLGSRPHEPNSCWLLPFRKHLRRMRAGVVLAYVAEQSRYRDLRCLAVWLRGRRGGTIGTSNIARLYRTTDFTLRKEVVRALQRMHAWAVLRRIELCEREPRIRKLARQLPARSHRSRMNQFLQQVSPCKLPLGSTALHEQEGLNLHGGLPPRTPSFIRAVLERIRRLVRGDRRVSPTKV